MMRWSLSVASAIRTRAWADEPTGLAYCTATGQTHLLDLLSLELLILLQPAPRSAESLRQQLAEAFDDASPAQVLAHIEAALLTMQDQGLIRGQPW